MHVHTSIHNHDYVYMQMPVARDFVFGCLCKACICIRVCIRIYAHTFMHTYHLLCACVDGMNTFKVHDENKCACRCMHGSMSDLCRIYV